MSKRGKVLLIAAGVIVLAGFVSLGVSKRRQPAVEVKLEKVARRDLVSIVTASGKIEPEQSVDILSDIMGRIVYLPLQEGNFVQRGQVLVKLDTATYAAAVEQAQAGVASARANVTQAQANLDQAQRAYSRARDVRASNAQLISQESVEQLQTAQEVAAANLDAAQRSVDQAVANLRNYRDQLSKTTIISPLSGQVTRLAVKQGEVAVPGTFSRETGLLMTVSDMSVIEARVNVDETDVVRIKLGDSAEVSIDAFPDTSFTGHVTKIANSSVTGASTSTSGLVTAQQAVDFEVRVTLDRPPRNLRPDLSATARIITDTRKQALSVPIIALTVRQPTPTDTTKPRPASGTAVAQNAPRYQTVTDTSQAHRNKEVEGVFVVDSVTHIAHFTPVRVGVAGEEYFELLSGLKDGETIVAGTYQAIKDLRDGARVKGQAAGRSGGAARP
ncbi:MAG TPA: efflux RND transporter periplasmic adaptor subunit [Gemmatimonadales bacterium]|nr:efflux RND transporter periplasmic adaptor subunit [Gemmatimonadales bacterium]